MKWPHEEVSDSSNQFPAGLYKVKVTKQEDAEARNGQFAIAVESRILEPSSMKGQNYNFMFVIGVTDDTAEKLGLDEGDLSAENEATWVKNPSARRYKGYLKQAGVVSTGDTDEEAEDVKGKTLYIQHGQDKGGYWGAQAFYPGDEPPAGSEPAESTLSKTTTKKLSEKTHANARPAPGSKKPAPKPAPEEEEDENWEE